jgi:hypothetical protein
MDDTSRRQFDLDALRTDGWFERIGEGIGSFRALCDIVGERFFAFSIIVGARITSLTVDRRSPDQSIVDFVVGTGEQDDAVEPQRMPLADFRRWVVGALLVDDDMSAPDPVRDTDIECLQLFLGVKYLLLAPIFGYSLRSLVLGPSEGVRAELVTIRDATIETVPLDQFRVRLRALVQDELERGGPGSRGTIDLSRIGEADAAARGEDWVRVVQLLGSWPAPLAIFLRTPEGQMLTPDARALIAKGLGLLGTACVRIGESDQAEEVFRIGIQYAHDGVEAADLFRRLGDALLSGDRPGEAIAPLRRAAAYGGPPGEVMPALARAFIKRSRWVAAYGCLREALAAGATGSELVEDLQKVEAALGEPLAAWKTLKPT